MIFGQLTVDENLRIGATGRAGGERARRRSTQIFELFPVLRERFKDRRATCPAASSRCWRSAAR